MLFAMQSFRLLTCLLAASSLVALAASETINMVKVHVDSFWVVGLGARTTNAKEATGEGEIPKAWRKLYTEGVLESIPKKVDDRVIALYTDYANGKDGEYTYVLGAKVSSADDLPAGLVAKKVVSGDYALFTAQGGPVQQLVVGLWQHIWSADRELHRAYRTDFEVHTNPADPQNAQVDINIGLAK